MRDADENFDNCEGWTEASFIHRLAQLSNEGGRLPGEARSAAASPAVIFRLATNGLVTDLQNVLLGRAGAGGGEALSRAMPDLFSTVGMLEDSWKSRDITFSEAIRGLFTIREVVRNLESGRATAASAMHFFGSGLVGVVDGEEHQFGAQIAAEKLFVSGWRTDVNVRSGIEWIIERASREHFHFAGISVGSDEALAGLADRISELRDVSMNRSIDVILGGAVFAYSKSSFEFLGADHIARTVDDAIIFLKARASLLSSGSTLSH